MFGSDALILKPEIYVFSFEIYFRHEKCDNESLLDTIRILKLKSSKHEQEGRVHSARSIDGVIYSIWSLLPSFCNYPLDTAESYEDLEKVLWHTFCQEPDLRGVICSSLQILIRQNKTIVDGESQSQSQSEKVSVCEQRAVSRYALEVTTRNLDVLRLSAHDILSTLGGIFRKSDKDDGGSIQKTIGEFASIADKGIQKEADRRAKPEEIANRRRKREQDPEEIKRLRN
ncbi:hypothetical protein LXL04_037884 [Taraxacum kok-saghyz]